MTRTHCMHKSMHIACTTTCRTKDDQISPIDELIACNCQLFIMSNDEATIINKYVIEPWELCLVAILNNLEEFKLFGRDGVIIRNVDALKDLFIDH